MDWNAGFAVGMAVGIAVGVGAGTYWYTARNNLEKRLREFIASHQITITDRGGEAVPIEAFISNVLG